MDDSAFAAGMSTIIVPVTCSQSDQTSLQRLCHPSPGALDARRMGSVGCLDSPAGRYTYTIHIFARHRIRIYSRWRARAWIVSGEE
jgi:hypothetical protein